MMRIISRAEWGASPPRSRAIVPASERTELTIHYDGDVPISYRPGECKDVCYPKIRNTQRFHQLTRGWADIGYNFWICNAHGNVFEGRGWDVQGAHASPSGPGNRRGIGVQVHIGGGQQPSPAALAALVWLHGVAYRRYGRRLAFGKHKDWLSTSCPGLTLSRWADQNRNRTPDSGTTTPTTQIEEEPEMKTATAGYGPAQTIPGDGKEHEIGVVKDGIWNFHAAAGPFIAQVNGWLQSESTNAQVVIVADTDKTGGRRWVGRETLTPAAPAFQVVGVGSLGAGECLRVLVINHDSAREVQVGNLSVSVIYQEG